MGKPRKTRVFRGFSCVEKVAGISLARQPFEDLDSALEGAQLARRELGEPCLEAGVARRGFHHVGLAAGAEAKLEPAAVVGIGLSLDKAASHQRVDRAADRRRAASDPGGDLVERGGGEVVNRAHQLDLLAAGARGTDVPAHLFDQSRKARRDACRLCCPPHDFEAIKYF